MTIRDFREEDIESIVDLYNATVLETEWTHLNGQQREVMLFKGPKGLDIARNIMSSNITLVFEEDKQVVGFSMMTQKGYVRFLYVNKKSLGKGLGRRLIREVESKAVGLGLEKTFLHSSCYASEREIYEKLGYENKGPEDYEVAGVLFRGNRMERILEFS